MTDDNVATQVIANLVVSDAAGRVLLVRYDADDEKWWLPGQDVAPFTHPDDAASAALAQIGGIACEPPRLHHVESFRGRRGWHLVFHYAVAASGEPGGGPAAAWFPADRLPATRHGGWERQQVAAVLGRAQAVPAA